MDITWHRVYLAMGSNEGDRAAHLQQALNRLPPAVQPVTVSSVVETMPAYYPDQPTFLNAACAAQTTLSPHELLVYLKNIEQSLGRKETGIRYGPRPIDLDILFYDDLVIETASLTIPHPRLAERGFVLVPLAEIAAGLRHPRTGDTVRTLLDRLPEPTGVLSVYPGLVEKRGHEIEGHA